MLWQKEKEDLRKRIIDLESKLDQKQALELEIERMRGAKEIIRHMGEEGDTESEKKKILIEQELREKEEELENLGSLNQTLIIKERKCNDEVQEARKELIQVSYFGIFKYVPCLLYQTILVLDEISSFSLSWLWIWWVSHPLHSFNRKYLFSLENEDCFDCKFENFIFLIS